MLRGPDLNDWLALLEVRHPKAIDLGLERCRIVWERMGQPQPARELFMVAGTNGKGSTIATLCAFLEALGLRYGSYTSPHILRFNERVRISGIPVSDAELVEAFEQVEAARRDVSLSYFEFSTLAAFRILSGADLDFAVLEVGLGGRLDAVNLVDAHCAVITPIGLDHQDYLGDDLESIGYEKAGIIRPGRPVISGESDPPASILQQAASLDAPLKRLGKDFTVEAVADGMRFCVDGKELRLPAPVLAGSHQLGNAATAIAALLQLIPDAIAEREALARGMKQVRLSGRLERVAERPAVWIDVGHNPMAARAVARAVRQIMEREQLRECRCVLGLLADKNAGAVAAELDTLVSSWYCAGLTGPRGQEGDELAKKLQEGGRQAEVLAFDSVHEALTAALRESRKDDGVLVFGSFLTAEEAFKTVRGDL
jgi:dihydrofolate synthase/folylpolyglutamate synthase